MLKLRKFKKRKLTNKNIMVSFAILIGFLSIGYLSKSYAIYKLEKKYDLIQSKIGTFTNGDVKVAVLVDGKETNEFPSYETNYKIESVECTNGVTGSFDVENWQVTIADMKATSTKCTVSFNSKKTNEITPINMSKKDLIALNEEYQNVAYNNLKTQLLNDTYPVGSIYMSTTDDTVEKVQTKFCGTWVRYASDTTLVGYKENTNKVNDTGGSKAVTLTTDNLPSHSHVIPELSVSSWTGIHSHTYTLNLQHSDGGETPNESLTSGLQKGGRMRYFGKVDSTSITVYGQKTTASNTTTCTNCSAKSINIQNPYTVVYMYKRTA